MESIKIKFSSNAEILACNALPKLLDGESLDPHTLKLICAVVWNVIDQLEDTPELKKYNIKIND